LYGILQLSTLSGHEGSLLIVDVAMGLWRSREARWILTRAVPAARTVASVILGIGAPCLALLTDVEDLEDTDEAKLGGVHFLKVLWIDVDAGDHVVAVHLVQH